MHLLPTMAVNRRLFKPPRRETSHTKLVIASLTSLYVLYIFLTLDTKTRVQEAKLRAERWHRPNRPSMIQIEIVDHFSENPVVSSKEKTCPYQTLKDLTQEELNPREGERHMVTPPMGGKVSLVCCSTTKGPLSIAVHHKWARNGAQRFMDMVEAEYFNTGVPMMRCLKGFLCQFGLHSNVEKKREFKSSIVDDPNWLPEGPKHRENEEGVKRFAQGYLAYAGAGPKTRSNQVIVALEANGPLAGGSPWEVPWGELVGSHSFDTLSHIYTGYGENGPSQGYLQKHGFDEKAQQDFPLLDHILSCELLDERFLPEEGEKD